jgi:hypothetical protein
MLFDRILNAVRDDNGHPKFRRARFDEATFKGDAGFDEATFKDKAHFFQATFEGDALFDGASSEGTAWFHAATFESDARFDGTLTMLASTLPSSPHPRQTDHSQPLGTHLPRPTRLCCLATPINTPPQRTHHPQPDHRRRQASPVFPVTSTADFARWPNARADTYGHQQQATTPHDPAVCRATRTSDQLPRKDVPRVVVNYHGSRRKKPQK